MTYVFKYCVLKTSSFGSMADLYAIIVVFLTHFSCLDRILQQTFCV